MTHINRPDNRFLRRAYRRCPVDECITEQVTRFEAWYDATTWCCKCGESWAGGEMYPRPFQRGWRKRAQQFAREQWDRATFGGPPSLQELDPELFAELAGGAS